MANIQLADNLRINAQDRVDVVVVHFVCVLTKGVRDHLASDKPHVWNRVLRHTCIRTVRIAHLGSASSTDRAHSDDPAFPQN